MSEVPDTPDLWLSDVLIDVERYTEATLAPAFSKDRGAQGNTNGNCHYSRPDLHPTDGDTERFRTLQAQVQEQQQAIHHRLYCPQ